MKELEHLSHDAHPTGQTQGMFSFVCTSIWTEGVKRMEPGSFQWHLETGQEAVGTNWNTTCSVWTLGNSESDRALEL